MYFSYKIHFRTAKVQITCHVFNYVFQILVFQLPFWYWLTWVVPDKGPLNRCVVCVYFNYWTTLQTNTGASTPYKRWSKCTMKKIGGERFLQELSLLRGGSA